MKMIESANKRTLLEDYDYVKVGPGLYIVDVENVQASETNSEWRRLGEALARHLNIYQKSAVLVSTLNLEHYLLDDSNRLNTDICRASFEHEGKRYMVTSLEQTHLEHTLPDIVESEEFVFNLNVWLCFFENAESSNAQLLCKTKDTTFVHEMKRVISNMNTEIELTIELIAAVPDSFELLWFNPKI